MIPIYQPFLTKETLKYAHEAIDSTWISNLGEFKEKASDCLRKYLKINNCILTSNGTTATHLIYKALKIKKPKLKNILVPNNVYVAAWNSMLFDNDNIKLIPISTDLETWNIDLSSLEEELKTRNPEETAILIVHNVGGIVNTIKIKEKFPDFEIIEDNCEGLFGKYEESFSGTKCLASSVSFYGNKTITSGEGGAVFFSDEDLYSKLNKIHSQGQSDKRYIHDVLGYNYRMTNVQAAILYGQLMNLQEILNRKEEIFSAYRRHLSDQKNIIFQKKQENCTNATWMFTIRLKGNKNFEEAKKFFDDNGIETRNMFYPMSYHEHLKQFSNPSIEHNDVLLSKEVIMFPSSAFLTKSQVEYISEKIIQYSEIL